jgi:23S rRNA pseudouridine2605 synthase
MDLVQQGKIQVNGKIVKEPSFPVSSADKIFFGSRQIKSKKHQHLLLYKPSGVATTRKDCFAERTVIDCLPDEFRHLNPVGRLDKDTEGLLLFTNDGDLAYRLTHPRFSVDKVYLVIITGVLSKDECDALERGVVIDGEKTAPCQIKDVNVKKDQTTLRMVLHEGRKRQVRQMISRVGHKVVFLKRERQGPITLGSLRPGEWRLLTEQEITKLNHL